MGAKENKQSVTFVVENMFEPDKWGHLLAEEFKYTSVNDPATWPRGGEMWDKETTLAVLRSVSKKRDIRNLTLRIVGITAEADRVAIEYKVDEPFMAKYPDLQNRNQCHDLWQFREDGKAISLRAYEDTAHVLALHQELCRREERDPNSDPFQEAIDATAAQSAGG